jgi:site-specific recombinase XerC
MGLITFARVSFFYKSIRTLKKLKADRCYHYLKKSWYRLRNPKKSSSNYRIIPYKAECKEEQMELIDIEKPNYRYLRRALFDFVYSSGDRLKDVAIFRASPESGTFLLKGKEKKRVVQVGGNSINATL